MVGLVLYTAAFNFKQELSVRKTQTTVFLLLICLFVVAVEVQAAAYFWGTMDAKIPERVILTLLVCSSIMRFNQTSPRSFLFCMISSAAFAIIELLVVVLAMFEVEARVGEFFGGAVVLVGHYLIMHGSILHCNLQ